MRLWQYTHKVCFWLRDRPSHRWCPSNLNRCIYLGIVPSVAFDAWVCRVAGSWTRAAWKLLHGRLWRRLAYVGSSRYVDESCKPHAEVPCAAQMCQGNTWGEHADYFPDLLRPPHSQLLKDHPQLFCCQAASVVDLLIDGPLMSCLRLV